MIIDLLILITIIALNVYVAFHLYEIEMLDLDGSGSVKHKCSTTEEHKTTKTTKTTKANIIHMSLIYISGVFLFIWLFIGGNIFTFTDTYTIIRTILYEIVGIIFLFGLMVYTLNEVLFKNHYEWGLKSIFTGLTGVTIPILITYFINFISTLP